MALPDLTENGDLPVGVHRATINDVLECFGHGSTQRIVVTRRLLNIYRMAISTGHLEKFIIFGSYITRKVEPNDVDIILVMDDEFKVETLDSSISILFRHLETEIRLGASVFWIKPGLLLLETLEQFVEHWQVKRDGTRRGIVEVIDDLH